MLCDNFDVTLSDMQVLIADKGIIVFELYIGLYTGIDESLKRAIVCRNARIRPKVLRFLWCMHYFV